MFQLTTNLFITNLLLVKWAGMNYNDPFIYYETELKNDRESIMKRKFNLTKAIWSGVVSKEIMKNTDSDIGIIETKKYSSRPLQLIASIGQINPTWESPFWLKLKARTNEMFKKGDLVKVQYFQ